MKLLLEFFEFIFRHLIEVDEAVARFFHGMNQLIELELHDLGVAVLRVLNEEHHEEGDDGRAGVDDELPGVREAEERPGRRPDDDGGHREDRRPRRADGPGRFVRESVK